MPANWRDDCSIVILSFLAKDVEETLASILFNIESKLNNEEWLSTGQQDPMDQSCELSINLDENNEEKELVSPKTLITKPEIAIPNDDKVQETSQKSPDVLVELDEKMEVVVTQQPSPSKRIKIAVNASDAELNRGKRALDTVNEEATCEPGLKVQRLDDEAESSFEHASSKLSSDSSLISKESESTDRFCTLKTNEPEMKANEQDLERESRIEKRNRISVMKNALYISTLCIKEEPIDEFTEVDVQVYGTDDEKDVNESFTTDVRSLNSKSARVETSDFRTGFGGIDIPLKMYSCHRNVHEEFVRSDEMIEMQGERESKSEVIDSNLPVSNEELSKISQEIIRESQISKEVKKESLMKTPTKVNPIHQPDNEKSPTFFKCRNCILYFKSRESYHFHMKSTHGATTNGVTSGKHICKLCQAILSTKKQLLRHITFKHGSRNSSGDKCSICGLNFFYRRSLDTLYSARVLRLL